MNMQIETIPAYRIAYIRHMGPYGAGNTQTMEKARSNDLFHHESILLGIAHDHPEITPPENYRYDACIVISDQDCIDHSDISLGNVTGGRYAVFLIIHTAEAVEEAWLDVFPELIKQSYQFDPTRPILERYAAEMVSRHYCKICVPIW